MRSDPRIGKDQSLIFAVVFEGFALVFFLALWVAERGRRLNSEVYMNLLMDNRLTWDRKKPSSETKVAE
jgi:hypothetical protein